MGETWVRSLGWEIPWRRERLSTPGFWPREFHGLHSPSGHQEPDMMRDFHLHRQRWRKAFRWAPGCTPLPRAPGPTRRAQAVGRSTNSCPPEPKTPSSTSSTASAAQNLNLDASKLAVRFSPHSLLVLPSWG